MCGGLFFGFCALIAIVIPDVLYIFTYTAMGKGSSVSGFAADDSISLTGDALAVASGVWMMVLFCFDWNPASLCQLLWSLILFGLFFATATFKSVKYPWAGGLICLIASLGTLGVLRAKSIQAKQSSSTAYGILVWCFFCCGGTIFVIWLGWMAVDNRWWDDDTKAWLTAENLDVYNYFDVSPALCSTTTAIISPDDAQAKIIKKCKKAKTVWFLQWAGPFVVIVVNFVCGLLCAVFDHLNLHGNDVENRAEVSLEQRKSELTALLRRCVLILSFGIACMYASLYISGASVNLGSALLCLAAAGTSFLIGWMYLEVDQKLLAEVAKTAPFADYVARAVESDWVKAIVVGGLHLFIPFMAFLDTVRQQVRIYKRTGEAGEKYTPKGKAIVEKLSTWYWVSIFSKVILLGELFVILIVGSKFTFVFFSWLNESLAKSDFEFPLVSGMVFVIGFGMFMCPIVPGSAVYLFAGVVLGAQAQADSAPGFWPGTVIACAVGSFAKLLACCGQYSMGYIAGKSVKVQQFVGVDKVPTRAMEQVLKTSGMSPGKVCILVAGPDFPVSMLCGILQLNIPNMLLGTLPVILVSIIPQTLVGALLTKDGGDTGVWSMISTGVTGFAAIFQAGATFVYIYFIMRTIEVDGDKLSKPRPEHAAVAELTKKEMDYVLAYKTSTDWRELSEICKGLIISSVAAFLLAGFMIAADFVVVDKFCFRPFAITDSIGASYDLGGLNGSALKLVMPIGWCALGLVFLGFALNYFFKKLCSQAARARLQSQPQSHPAPKPIGQMAL